LRRQLFQEAAFRRLSKEENANAQVSTIAKAGTWRSMNPLKTLIVSAVNFVQERNVFAARKREGDNKCTRAPD